MMERRNFLTLASAMGLQVVALYPLDAANFPVSPAVTNDNQVNNHTDNRHSVDGYLDSPIVARWILDALG